MIKHAMVHSTPRMNPHQDSGMYINVTSYPRRTEGIDCKILIMRFILE